jgi:hypothetical protein
VSSSALPSLPAPGMEMVPISDPSAGLMTRTKYLLLHDQRLQRVNEGLTEQ